MMDQAIFSAMQSEYCSKYACKADSTDLNKGTLLTAHIMSNVNKTDVQKSTCIIQSMLNMINGSIAYPLVLTTSYLLGHGDYWFPHKTVHYDPYPFTAVLKQTLQLNATADDGDDTTTHDLVTSTDGTICVMQKNLSEYQHRNDALSNWSSVELAMSFSCGPSTSKASQLLKLRDGHSKPDHGHNPRTEAAMSLPQFSKELPLCPADTAPYEEKELWAAFALGNFFPYDRCSDVLLGDCLWDKIMHWRTAKPRGIADTLAWTWLDNIQLRCLARVHMRVAHNATRVQRAEMKKTAISRGEYTAGDASDSDCSDFDYMDCSGCGASDEVMASQASLMECDFRPGASSYETDAMQPLQTHIAPSIHTAFTDKEVQTADSAFNEEMQSACSNLVAGKDAPHTCPKPNTKWQLQVISSHHDVRSTI